MQKHKFLTYSLSCLALTGVLFLTGCEEIDKVLADQNKQFIKLKKENKQLKTQIEKLNKDLGDLQKDSAINSVLVSLYDLRHALEKYALANKGQYPYANNISELQAAVKSFLPENFEIEPIYLEKVRSQERGYIMVANVKGNEIVVSNLL